jgi:hypothetical protein
MPAPFVKRPHKVVAGFFFRPEIAQQFGRVGAELRALFSDECLLSVLESAIVWCFTTPA